MSVPSLRYWLVSLFCSFATSTIYTLPLQRRAIPQHVLRRRLSGNFNSHGGFGELIGASAEGRFIFPTRYSTPTTRTYH